MVSVSTILDYYNIDYYDIYYLLYIFSRVSRNIFPDSKLGHARVSNYALDMSYNFQPSKLNSILTFDFRPSEFVSILPYF